MAGAIKVRNKHPILVILDADKLADFKAAIKNKPIGEFFRQYQDDVVDEYRKNLEAQENPLGLPGRDERQTTMDQYNINPFRSDKYELEGIRRFLMFEATEEEIREAATNGLNLLKHARTAKINFKNRMLIKR